MACEFSGIVRAAFSRRGHFAASIDFLPTEQPGGWHRQGDLLEVLHTGWDLMIAHPPCTYLSAAGLHFCRGNKERQAKRDEALKFVKSLMDAPIPHIAIENPVGYLSTAWRKPDQVVYMNDFGHAEARKPTCLWLKGLPKIQPTNSVPHIKSGGKRTSQWYESTRCPKKRSRTFPNFAEALADQWNLYSKGLAKNEE